MLTGLALSDALRIRPYQSEPIFHSHKDTVGYTSNNTGNEEKTQN
jgi:hypothetical protein